MFRKVIAFLRLSRPIFLVGGIILYALGALIARYQGYRLEPGMYLLGQLFALSLQLMAHYLNEYWDVAADQGNRSRTPLTGGSGVLPEGSLPPGVAFQAALACMAVNSAAAIALIFQYGVGPAAWGIMLLAWLGAFFYSTPPVRLISTGYGELITSIIVAGLLPAFAHLLHSGRPSLLVLLATAPLVLFHYAMIITFEYPDYMADEAAGKRTLLVRIGRRAGYSVHNALVAGGLALAALASLVGLPPRVAISIAIVAPLAALQVIHMRRLRRGEPVSFPRLTFGALALFGLAAYLIAFSFWVIAE